MNIISMIRDQLSPQILGQIGNSIGESPEATKSALATSLPALLGSVASAASTPQGAGGLMDALKQHMPQGGWTDSIGSLLGGMGSSASGTGESTGGSIVSSLLGSKANLLRDFIASKSGIRSESATSLMGIAGKILMGFLGKQVMTQGLSASGLGEMLRSQIPHLQGLIPAGLVGSLGLGKFLGSSAQAPPVTAGTATSQSGFERGYEREEPARVATATASSGSKALRWALVPLALALVALFVFRHKEEPAVGGTAEDSLAARSAGAASSIGNFADQVKGAITRADATPISLQGVSFDNAGDLSADAKSKLNEVGKLINSTPQVNATITAYGKTSEEAASRADAIKGTLTATGISSDRVRAQGQIGEGWPKISFAK
jgi:hypothetical protein